MPVSEYEQIRMRASAMMSADIAEKVYGDTEILVNAIAARVELARGEAIFNSAVTLNENGVQASVNFGLLAEHTTATEINWTDTETSTVFDDLEAWRDLMVDNTGKAPRWALMPSRIARVMRSNAQLCRMSTTDYNAPSVLSLDELNALLLKHELPQVTTYDARVVFQGTAQRITPASTRSPFSRRPATHWARHCGASPRRRTTAVTGWLLASRAARTSGTTRPRTRRRYGPGRPPSSCPWLQTRTCR